jgi:transposase
MNKSDLNFEHHSYNVRIKVMIAGIDISKLKFDVTLLLENGKERHKTFSNNGEGFKALETWLHHLGAKNAHICLEATGYYGEKVSLFLHEQGHKVSVINPARIKAYAKSEKVRVKTDKVDSGVIARFCKAQHLPVWVPPSLEERQLRDLYRCLQNLLEDKTRLSNRMENLDVGKASCEIWDSLLGAVEEKIRDVEKQIEILLKDHKGLGDQIDLLKTIPGVSQRTAVAILSELPNIEIFDTAKEAAAFAGLTPNIRQSGTSLSGKGSLSKVGNAQLRKALFMPTLVAKRYNPAVEEFCNRLAAKGKAKMVVIAAGMRKLLHIIFGVLKNKKPFVHA